MVAKDYFDHDFYILQKLIFLIEEKSNYNCLEKYFLNETLLVIS